MDLNTLATGITARPGNGKCSYYLTDVTKPVRISGRAVNPITPSPYDLYMCSLTVGGTLNQSSLTHSNI
jgi:hypothetical protein